MDNNDENYMVLNHPLAVKILIPVQIVLAIISIPSGALLVYLPSGEAIGARVILPHLTRSIPFIHDFTPVGIFLIGVYGFLPLLLSYGLWVQKRWAWILTMLLGIGEIVWIATEVVIFYDLGFFFFYPIIAGMGMITLALCVLPSVRKFYSGIVERNNASKVQQLTNPKPAIHSAKLFQTYV